MTDLQLASASVFFFSRFRTLFADAVAVCWCEEVCVLFTLVVCDVNCVIYTQRQLYDK